MIEEPEDNLDRLEASGISVTVIEKKKSQEKSAAAISAASAEPQPKKTPQPPAAEPSIVAAAAASKKDIGLSSDISVTVVQKKKMDVGGGVASSGPKISVKKESELLQKPTNKASEASSEMKDVVEVTSRAKQPRRASQDIEAGKTPPDPIVTISKVQNAAAALPGASLLKSSAMPKSSSPAIQRNLPPAGAAPPPTMSTPPTSAAASSLASILGQPRMAASSHPRFPPGAAPGRSMAPPHIPRNSSPLTLPPGLRPPVSLPMGMPNLHPRPPSGVLGAPPVTPPVGPVSEQLNKVAGKLVDFMRGTLEELFKELSSQVLDHTVWKCQDFSVAQILREINFNAVTPKIQIMSWEQSFPSIY